MDKVNLKILLIEDDLNHAELIKRNFKKNNSKYFLEHVTTLKDAVSKLQNKDTDFIVCDFQLPDGEGIDILDEIKPEFVLPVIILTSFGNEKIAVEAMKSGAWDYIVKSESTFSQLPHIIDKAYNDWKNFLDKKRIEQELAESNNRYKYFYENTPVMLLSTDKEGNIISVSNMWLHNMQFSVDEVVNKNFMEFLSDNSQLIYSEIVKKTFSEKRGLNDLHMELIKKDGSRIEVLYSAVEYYDKDGNHVNTLAVINDITEKRLAEDKILKLSNAVENSPVSILILDRYGYVEYVNIFYEENTGYKFPELKGKLPPFFYKNNEINSGLSELIASQLSWKGEIRTNKKNGQVLWQIVSISPIKNAYSRNTNFICVCEDITSRKLIEQELILAKDVAEKSDKLKSEFLAQMSHEIRTPINTILSFLSLIREDVTPVLNDELETSFNTINSAGRRLIRTIDLILNMAEIQTGSFQLTNKHIDLYAMIKNIFNEYSTRKNDNVKFILNKTFEDAVIYADEYSIEQIFDNLINNAVKFTSYGSIEVSLLKEKNELLSVKIKDTGIGISPDYLPYLFSPFSQEDQGYTRRFEGNGLGLALVKKYCDLNGIDITVNSEKWRGTEFKLYFK